MRRLVRLLPSTTLVDGIFLTLCLFFIMTPGFGVQYLSWLSYFAIIASWELGLLYTWLGGIFLYRVYTYWSGQFPMYYANPDVVGQWVGFEKTLDLALWMIVVLMFMRALRRLTASGRVQPVA